MANPLPRLSDYTSGKITARELLGGTPSFSGVLGGKPEPKGRTVRAARGTMNKTEAAYAEHLEMRRNLGLLAAWWFEALKFRLADKTWYAPDFMVMQNDGTLELHEVKGHVEDDAMVKIKVASEMFWQFPVYMVKRRGPSWTLMRIGA